MSKAIVKERNEGKELSLQLTLSLKQVRNIQNMITII